MNRLVQKVVGALFGIVLGLVLIVATGVSGSFGVISIPVALVLIIIIWSIPDGKGS